MYTREEASLLRQKFWTTFGQYMAPVLSSEGLRTNWINYNTRLKHVNFKMDAGKQTASVAIEITHPDPEIQELFFEQFLTVKAFLHESVNEPWDWQLHVPDETGRTICRISKTIKPVNIFNKEDWPQLISFFKPRIIAFDEFWNNAVQSFDELR